MTIGFAHRGAHLEHPDNTLAGFARALELGARGLETDAWVTADGVAVLDHDGTVGRIRKVPIAAVARDRLPRHVPTLGELLALPGAADADLSIDVKAQGAWAPAVTAARSGGADLRRLWLCAADVDELVHCRRREPSVRLVHSTAPDRIDGGLPGLATHARRLADAGIDAVNLRATRWSADLVDACHAAGLLAFGWDAQRRDQVERLVAIGIDGVYSDHVAMMVEALGAPRPGYPSSG